jgi:hypothetical protein
MPDTAYKFGPQAPPDAIFAAAGLEPFRDPVGRIAWAKADAPMAARLLSQNGYAITRVEVWCICNENTYSAVIPYIDGLYGRFDWRQEDAWSPEHESWEDFCARCSNWALSKIPVMNYEPMLTADYPAERMRIHLFAVSQREYE